LSIALVTSLNFRLHYPRLSKPGKNLQHNFSRASLTHRPLWPMSSLAYRTPLLSKSPVEPKTVLTSNNNFKRTSPNRWLPSEPGSLGALGIRPRTTKHSSLTSASHASSCFPCAHSKGSKLIH